MLRSNLQGRHLFIDCDICLIGSVLHELSKTTEDFIISPSRVIDPHSSHVSELYYDFSALQKIDPDFQYPGYVFNSGQYVFTANRIPQERINEIWDLNGVPKKNDQVFRLHDQGGFNYLLQKLDQQSIITVGLVDFKIFASTDNPEFTALTKNDIVSGRYPKLVHWAGDKGEVTACFTSQWILEFYEDFYYSEVRFGCLKKKLRAFGRRITAIPSRVLTKIKIIGSRIKKLRYSITK